MAAWLARTMAAVHVALDRWAAPDRGPRAAFNAGARAWQLHKAVLGRTTATRLRRPDGGNGR
jgi:hypothetical protein